VASKLTGIARLHVVVSSDTINRFKKHVSVELDPETVYN